MPTYAQIEELAGVGRSALQTEGGCDMTGQRLPTIDRGPRPTPKRAGEGYVEGAAPPPEKEVALAARKPQKPNSRSRKIRPSFVSCKNGKRPTCQHEPTAPLSLGDLQPLPCKHGSIVAFGVPVRAADSRANLVPLTPMTFATPVPPSLGISGDLCFNNAHAIKGAGYFCTMRAILRDSCLVSGPRCGSKSSQTFQRHRKLVTRARRI